MSTTREEEKTSEDVEAEEEPQDRSKEGQGPSAPNV